MKPRLVFALFATGLLAAPFERVAAQESAEGSVSVNTVKEAWYITPTSEACATLNCSALSTEQAYPINTLHVGISGGKTTNETFIELDLPSANLPAGATLTAGVLRLPVDTASGDGSVRYEEADLRLCQVTGFIRDSKVAVERRPETDCGAASADAKYSEEPGPTFTVDLSPFLSAWTEGESPSLAILPAPKSRKSADTWHVTFFGKDHGKNKPDDMPGSTDSTQAKAITAKLWYEYENGVIEVPPPESGAASPPPLPDVPAIGTFDQAPDVGIDLVPASPPGPDPSLTAPDATPPPVAIPEYVTVGYQYPISWLLPLLLLIGVCVTGISLTKNLEPRRRLT